MGAPSGRSATTGPTRISLRSRMRSRMRWRGRCKTKLLPGEHAAAQSERPPGGSLEAYSALLQGRFYHSRSHGSRLSQGDRVLRAGDAARSALCARLERSVADLDRPRYVVPRGRTGAAGICEGARGGRPRARPLAGPCGRAHCPGLLLHLLATSTGAERKRSIRRALGSGAE